MTQPHPDTQFATGPVGELLRRASAGDQVAWNSLVDRFSNLLWSVGRSYRLSDDDAADVVQNTWLRLLEHLDGIRNPEALPGWLATTARREALRILQRRGRDVLVRAEDLAENLPDPQVEELDVALLEDERDVALWQCFRQLSARCQQLLRVLMATDRPAYVEVSAAFDMPVGSIGPTRMRCLSRLRELAGQSSYVFGGPRQGWA
ncbi:MAG: sigma-70 family RNA polymerase sigma factor [Actinomycetota bacterium]|nr:sigma-70 family RNA polymerase sigma factor [Actinomycetota bacterium]